MGYSTDFSGELTIEPELEAAQLAYLNTILGEEVGDHPEWKYDFLNDTNYIALELTRNFQGLKWNGGEKVYGMTGAVNLVIQEMRKILPKFKLHGEMECHGEDHDDHWFLVINKDGVAEKRDVVNTSGKGKCPHCGEIFYLNEIEPIKK